MIDFFTTQKCKIYKPVITQNGASDRIDWVKRADIRAFVEPVNGESLLGSEVGNKENISLMMYTKRRIDKGERVYISGFEDETDGWYEIRTREFYRMPFFNYYKGN